MRPFNSPGSYYYPGTTPSCNRTPAMPTTSTYTSIWAPTVGQRRVFSAPLPHHHPQDHITPAPHSHPSQSTHPLGYPHPPLPSLNAMSSPLSPAAPSFYPSSQPTAPSSPATSAPRLSPPSPITIPAVSLPFPKPENVSGVVSFLDPSTKGDRSTPLLLTESVLEGYAKIYRALEEVRRELQHTREETKKEKVAKESAVRASAKQSQRVAELLREKRELEEELQATATTAAATTAAVSVTNPSLQLQEAKEKFELLCRQMNDALQSTKVLLGEKDQIKKEIGTG